MASNLGMTVLAEVLLIIPASGYREYLPISTDTYCPVKYRGLFCTDRARRARFVKNTEVQYFSAQTEQETHNLKGLFVAWCALRLIMIKENKKIPMRVGAWLPVFYGR